MSHDIFISHASEDWAVARQMCDVLESQGLRCWIAPRDVLPGQDWAEAIVAAIEQSKAMVLIFSQHANDSAAVGVEVEKAFGIGVPVFPFRIREVEPSKKLELFIRRVHWLDALTPPIEQQINNLANAVRSVLETEGTTERIAPIADSTGDKSHESGLVKRKTRRALFAGLAIVVVGVCTTALIALSWRPPPSPTRPRPPEPFRNSIGMSFVLIPAGGFRMGAPADDELARDMELPQHMVKISRTYYLGIHEVTQDQYAEIMGKTPSYWSEAIVGGPTNNYPVTNITWSEAVEFCRRLSEREELIYRLPTEAEWEYACRAGSTTRFPNGDDIEDLKRIAVIAGEDANPKHPIEVGCLEPNAFGLYDMLVS